MAKSPKKAATIQDVYDALTKHIKAVGDLPPPVPIDPNLPPPPRNCPEFCEGKASGTMAYCEDGVWTAIPPPTVDSTLKFNVSTGIPYWHPDS